MMSDRTAARKTESIKDYIKLRGLWRINPVLYARQRLGLNPTHQQQKILEAIAPHGAKVTVRSGHGIGKSSSTAAAIWWMLECFDYPKVPCTAPSASQLRDVLWSELAKWQRHADEVSRKWGLPHELWLSTLFRITQDRIADVGAPDEWFAVARTARPENPDALQGFHATDVTISADGRSVERSGSSGGQIMFVVEESSGVTDKVFEVAEGALSSPGARLLMVGNPTKNTGYFADSHKKNRSSYTPLHFKSQDSPLTASDYREKLVRKFGEGSNVVRVRADGEFPKQDDDTLIALEDAEAALVREAPSPTGDRRLGVDVARYGDDRTVFTLRQGSHVQHIEIHAKLSTTEVTGHAIRLYGLWDADVICVDADGIGSGVYDQLEEKEYPVIEVMVGRTAPPKKRQETEAQPYKLRDYLWMELANWMRNEKPSFAGVHPDIAADLAGELCSVTFSIDSSGRLVVESKDEMKRRGLRSPDIADSLMVTFVDKKFERQRRGLAFGSVGGPKNHIGERRPA